MISKCDCVFPDKLGRKKKGKQDGRKRYLDPIYYIWIGIIHRCSSKTYTNAEYYSSRGIRVCSSWQEDFYNFKKDVGDRPSPSHSIDRVDNSRGYCPHNVRWATPQEQALNTRKYREGSSRLLPGICFNRGGTYYLRMRLHGTQYNFRGFNSLFQTFKFRMEKYEDTYGIKDKNYIEAVKRNLHKIKDHSIVEYGHFKKYLENDIFEF